MNKLFIKISLHLILILAIAGNLYSQDYSTKTESAKSRFLFTITYKNKGNRSKHLVKVGIKSDAYGSFQCASSSDVLLPLADYIVRFHVSQKETIIDADPPIEIKPDEAVRFTISYAPSAVGACGIWSSEIFGILIFDDGEKTYTDSAHITGDDVKQFNRRTPEESEILAALKHRDAGLRIQAIRQLSNTTLDKKSTEFILKDKLDDQSASVRAEAAKVASEIGFKSLAKKIAFLLSNSQDGTEMAAYCTALGKFKDTDTVDALISALNNPKVDSFYPRKALLEFEHPDVIKKVRPLLLRNIKWADIEAQNDLAKRYLDICKIIISYRDMESVQALSDLINKPKHTFISRNIVSEMNFLTNENQIVQDPFILAMRPALEIGLKNSDSEIRYYALKLLCQMPVSDSTLQEFLRNGFKDSDKDIRILSAGLTAKLGYKSLANEIILLLKSSKSESEKERYCEALKKLEMSCQ
ncbi:MAG: HEAT repeat domain-containing protein [Pyrinomonadaceae bacterium]